MHSHICASERLFVSKIVDLPYSGVIPGVMKEARLDPWPQRAYTFNLVKALSHLLCAVGLSNVFQTHFLRVADLNVLAGLYLNRQVTIFLATSSCF